MQELNRQLRQTSLADWKIYFKWQLSAQRGSILSDPFVNENFVFYGKYSGRAAGDQATMEALCRVHGCNCWVKHLGKKYVERYFPPEAKARPRKW